MNGRTHIASLDGTRGVAVALVVVFHAWPDVLPGGWIGVSVFFTLSGFLITRQLVGTGDDTPLALGSFWTRRIRRLAPASLVTIATATVATAVLRPEQSEETAREGLAALLHIHNWYSAASNDGYWELFTTDAPVLGHLWSLSIEEQVYVVWPLLVLGLGLRRALYAGTVVAVIGAAVWWGSADAYYATPVRFAEVLTGAWVAFAIGHHGRARVPAPVGVAAVVVIGALTLTLGEDSSWVAAGALPLIALASALVVASLALDPGSGRALRWSPVVWLGRRSYAIYLFHWPLLVLLDAPAVVAIVVSLVLAELSHRLIEWPVRSGARVSRPASTYGVAALVVAVVVAMLVAVGPSPIDRGGVVSATESALEVRASVTAATPASTTSAPAEPVLNTAEPEPEPEPVPDTRITLPASPSIVLVGDSTAVRAAPALEGWARSLDGEFTSVAVEACSPLLTSDGADRWELVDIPTATGCRVDPPDETDVLVVMDWVIVRLPHRDLESGLTISIEDAAFRDLLHASYRTSARSAGQMIIVTPPIERIQDHTAEEAADVVRDIALYRQLVLELAADHPTVRVLDLGPAIEADPQRYPRPDGLHLDWETGAVNFVVDLLAPSFRQ